MVAKLQLFIEMPVTLGLTADLNGYRLMALTSDSPSLVGVSAKSQ